jgi:antirestriction protein ArdC
MTDIYQTVTDNIVAALEVGTPPWVRPWRTAGNGGDGTFEGVDVNYSTQKPYQGVNILALWAARWLRGYDRGQWLTLKQARALGGNVRKGERGTHIVFWKLRELTVPGQTPADPDETRTYGMAKGYTVFNVAQCDGLDIPEPAPIVFDPAFAAARAFCLGTQADIRHGGDKAFYAPSSDAIQVPHPSQFEGMGHYFAAVLHELTHWTGAKHRLDRLQRAGYGSEAYAKEELIAELGAAFACACLTVPGQLRHAEYLQGWLTILKADKRAIFLAASAARKAHEYLKSLQPSAAHATVATDATVHTDETEAAE